MEGAEGYRERLAEAGYVADPALATTLALAEQLGRPLLLEGEAGVGKTAVAQALARLHGSRLIRLQCYEGLDLQSAVYEWDYQRQLLAIRLLEAEGRAGEDAEAAIFSERYLLRRPLLEAISATEPPVLLIDEIDRADEEFEAYLLEVLSEFQVTVPELGTLRAASRPRVLLTSNATRELSDALRRRCLYHYLDYPGLDKELAILEAHLPGIDRRLAEQAVRFVHELRRLGLRKAPGVAETLDWAAALMGLGLERIDQSPEALLETLSCLVKTRADRDALTPERIDALAAETR
ncbi:AAA family ATPase [Spiribacter halobius]|uniref:ATPase n=1 Tax=Sediminicurvatus halobius TaxID=2182432 RepID=A0A2U2N091_9GAMM|nr:MoxR family ATPase [Spiribacter halobius]PWG62389.1 ATPase [Spiribacter halobius]UEX79487.1 MoxR family ATPase [Spiribacter halobius]